jgi:hypothetical protein
MPLVGSPCVSGPVSRAAADVPFAIKPDSVAAAARAQGVEAEPVDVLLLRENRPRTSAREWRDARREVEGAVVLPLSLFLRDQSA